MQILTFAGIMLTVAAMIGLTYCIREGFRIRRSQLPAAEARAQLQRLVAINLASVGTAGLGLAMVVIGLML